MFLHLVVVSLSLGWSHIIGGTSLQDETAFDQIATASDDVTHTAEKLRQKEVSERSVEFATDTTIHYENSNGFVPMFTSSTSYLTNVFDPLEATTSREIANVTWSDLSSKPTNSSTLEDASRKKQDEQDNNESGRLDYSTKDRILLNFSSLSNNRRSFEYQGDRNEFELLKVKNDTPIVANYPDLYEDPTSSSETKDKENRLPSQRYGITGKEPQTRDYMGNHRMPLDEVKDDRSSYNDYYSWRNIAKDKDKQGQVKANVDYHPWQHLSHNYDDQGQTPTVHGESFDLFSSSKQSKQSKQQTNVRANGNEKDYGNIDDNASSNSRVAKNRNKFSRPVVVAESSYTAGNSHSDKHNYHIVMNDDSTNSDATHRHAIRDRDGRYRSDEDSRDTSDEEDYGEYTERSRVRVQKGKRRPSNVESSKRLPKEHRASMDDSTELESEADSYRTSRPKQKSLRQRTKGWNNSWLDEDRGRDQGDSYESSRYNGQLFDSESSVGVHSSQRSKHKPSNAWSQVSPNLEISHSNGVEIGQLEKPRLIVPVNVNLLPVGNFDHATAIGNSQGFDTSNAVLRNIVSSASPFNAVSTPSPVTSTTTSGLGYDAKTRLSTSVPDIIVGENGYRNSIHTIPQSTVQSNKWSANLKPQYVSSTIAPVYAVTPSANSGLQSVSIQDVQATMVTPRPTYVSASNRANVPQLMISQPTVSTVSVHTPLTNSGFNVQVNPRGVHGQNPIDPGILQVQAAPTMTTAMITPTGQTLPVARLNLLSQESQNQKTLLPTTDMSLLATASLADVQNANSFYFQNSNNQQMAKSHNQLHDGLYQQFLNNAVNVAPKTNAYVQTAHLLPALLHPMPTVATVSASTPQAMQTATGSQSHRLPNIRNTLESGDFGSSLTLKKLPSTLLYQSIDTAANHGNGNVHATNAFSSVTGTTETAHLPYVGTRNVEILNPNIKVGHVDTNVLNAFDAMHYPATTVLTTAIPMFASTGFVTARPALLTTTTAAATAATNTLQLRNPVISITETGSENNQQFTDDSKAYQSQNRPLFNPINFVPNADLTKNQNALNSKLHASEPLQPSLSLVPLIPGGNFFKPSFDAQNELLVKPKLSADLATYADQMFKESLKTMQNSQKWNNDRKTGNQPRQNASDSTDIAKLRSELQRLKASLSDSKRNKDELEGHQSETKVQKAELPSKKPDEFLAALEQMFKDHRQMDHSQIYRGSDKPSRYRRPDKYSVETNDGRPKESKHIRNFMTPSQPNSYHSKGHVRDKPGKKRPISGPIKHHGHRNNHHGPRSHSRYRFSHKTSGVEASATNVEPIYSDGFLRHENAHSPWQRIRSEFRKSSQAPIYSLPDKNEFFEEFKHQEGIVAHANVVNHPKVHNFFGLLMKNKQLPDRSGSSFTRDRDRSREFVGGEKHRLEKQFYDGASKNYLYKVSGGAPHSNLRHVAFETTPDRRSLSRSQTNKV